jgi:hypothetical protein
MSRAGKTQVRRLLGQDRAATVSAQPFSKGKESRLGVATVNDVDSSPNLHGVPELPNNNRLARAEIGRWSLLLEIPGRTIFNRLRSSRAEKYIWLHDNYLEKARKNYENLWGPCLAIKMFSTRVIVEIDSLIREVGGVGATIWCSDFEYRVLDKLKKMTEGYSDKKMDFAFLH